MFVRREVRSLSDNTLKFYAIAVKAMKEQPPDDPRSWSYQAAIHGSYDEHPKNLYNQCIHGSRYFVAWHRMYLYYFERIVRANVIKARGPEDWALPYWNYGIDDAHASIPEPFRTPAGEANSLYVQQRRPRRPAEPGRPEERGINEGAILPAGIRSDTAALECENYEGAGQFGGGTTPPAHEWGEFGQLERSPHNSVHTAVGGREGWMSFLETAGLDPIFWLHHSNIDRIWAQWSLTHLNPIDPTWLGQEFTFYDADKSEVTISVGQILDTKHDSGLHL